MNVTVTGAAGHLGSVVVRFLFESGFNVRATDMTAGKDSPVRVEIADLQDRDVCYGLLKGADAVVHLGNHPTIRNGMQPQRVFAENSTNNINVFQAAMESGVEKIIFSSSVQVISGSRKETVDAILPYLPLDGEAPAHTGNLYGLSKQAAEMMLAYFARNDGMECVAIRFPLLINEEWLEHSRKRPANPAEGWSFLHMSDAATLIEHCLNTHLPGFRAYFPSAMGTGGDEPLAEFVRKYYPGVPLKRPLEEIESFVDISRIRKEVGWTPKRNRLFEK